MGPPRQPWNSNNQLQRATAYYTEPDVPIYNAPPPPPSAPPDAFWAEGFEDTESDGYKGNDANHGDD